MSFLSLQEIGTDVNLDRDSGSIVSTLIGIEQDRKIESGIQSIVLMSALFLTHETH